MQLELNKITINYVEGFESYNEEGIIHKDKILPFLSIVYPYKGSYDIAIEDSPLTHFDDGCFIVSPYIRHTIIHHTPANGEYMHAEYMFLHIMYDNIDMMQYLNPPLIVQGESSQIFINAIRNLKTLNKQKSGYAEQFKRLNIAALVVEELLKISEFNFSPDRFNIIQPALRRIEQQYSSHITLSELAGNCSLSIPAFSTHFKKAVGTSPINFLIEKRLSHVVSFLLTDNLTLFEIAEKTGFYDEFHLSREFKKRYGVSPSRYKKEANSQI